MKRAIFIIPFLLLALQAEAQSGSSGVRTVDALTSLKEKEMDGKVVIWMDSLIEENYRKLLIQGSKQRGVTGYRIRIFSDNGLGAKEEQRRMRARFLSSFPEIPTYYPYEDSYYKIYVGDFRTKRDALNYLSFISEKFPDAFIVEDYIVNDD